MPDGSREDEDIRAREGGDANSVNKRAQESSASTDDEERVPVSKPPLKKRMKSQDYGSGGAEGGGGHQPSPKKSLPSESRLFADSPGRGVEKVRQTSLYLIPCYKCLISFSCVVLRGTRSPRILYSKVGLRRLTLLRSLHLLLPSPNQLAVALQGLQRSMPRNHHRLVIIHMEDQAR